MKLFLLLILFLSLISCGERQQTTANFKVTMGAIAGSPADFQGGLIVYGHSGPETFSRIMASTTSGDEEVTNGSWNFYAIGWEGPGAMEGKVFCGLVPGVDLNGVPSEISIVANNANCANPFFTPETYRKNGAIRFPKVQIESCKDISAITGVAQNCDYNLSTGLNNKGHVGSYQFILQSFNRVGSIINVLPEKIVSTSCGTVDSASSSAGISNTAVFENLNLPPGSGSVVVPLRLILRAYYGTPDCDATASTKGFKDFIMATGTDSDLPRVKSIGHLSDGQQYMKIYTQFSSADSCANRRDTSLSPTPFAAGAGTTGHPFLICNGKQLNAIGHEWATSSFQLANDIDMNPYTDAFDYTASPACSTDGGSNFFPIGGYNSTECASRNNGGSYANFTGNFDGNNKTIKGLRVSKDDGGSTVDDIGFIRKLDGGVLANTTFTGMELRANRNVGVVGTVIGTSFIKNIKVFESRFEGRDSTDSNVGAIVGFSNGSDSLLKTYSQIFVGDSDISADGSNVGGIVGKASFTAINQAIFHGFIDSHDQMINNYGGIVGLANEITLKEVASRGFISGGVNVGGIVGKIEGSPTTVIDHTYSQMLVKSQTDRSGSLTIYDNINVGGLVGHLDLSSSMSLDHSYFSGKVIHNCGPTATYEGLCTVGTVIGNNAGGGTLTSVYSATDTNLTSYGGDTGTATTYANLVHPASTFGMAVTGFGTAADFNFDSNGSTSSGTWASILNNSLAQLQFERDLFTSTCGTTLSTSSINTQKLNGRGFSADDPIILCTRTHFLNIYTEPGLFYQLNNSINIGAMAFASQINSFSGQFDGNGRILYNASINNNFNSGNNLGLFASTTSTALIKNLDVLMVSFSDIGTPTNKGGLVGSNNGIIDDVFVSGGFATTNVGGIVGINSAIGTIKNSTAFGQIQGSIGLGGIAYSNAGTIKLCSSESQIMINANSYDAIGGVAVINTGTIEQSAFGGRIIGDSTGTIYTSSVSATEGVGGIVAHNMGTIINTMVGDRAEIRISGFDNLIPGSASPIAVGGIVGFNDTTGIVQNSYTSAEININGGNATDGHTDIAYHGGIIGKNANVTTGDISKNYFFNSALGEIGFGMSGSDFTTDSCASGALIFKATSGSSYANSSGTIGLLSSPADGDIVKIRSNTNYETETLIANNIPVSFPLTALATYTFNFVGGCPTFGTYDSIGFYQESVQTNADIVAGTAQLTTTQFAQIGSFCQDGTISGDYFTCANGWDIVDGNYAGKERIFDWYEQELGGVTSSSTPPIWEIESGGGGDSFPRLFLLHNN